MRQFDPGGEAPWKPGLPVMPLLMIRQAFLMHTPLVASRDQPNATEGEHPRLETFSLFYSCIPLQPALSPPGCHDESCSSRNVVQSEVLKVKTTVTTRNVVSYK